MTEAMQERFLADRVRAMATVVLTRRGNLVVTEAEQSTGLDDHVFVARKDKPMRPALGVLLRGVSAPVTAGQANEVLGPTMGQFRGMRKFTDPVCLFFFTMREEQAFFSWLAEPRVTDAGPNLIHHDEVNCVPLTDELLDGIVGQVVSRYDSVQLSCELHGIAAALGMGPGSPGSNDPRAVAELFKRVRGDPALRRICELAGRFRRVAQSKQRMKATHGLDDVVGVEPGGDIGRLLPSELAKLMVPELELDTLRRIAEREALCREHHAVEPVGKAGHHLPGRVR